MRMPGLALRLGWRLRGVSVVGWLGMGSLLQLGLGLLRGAGLGCGQLLQQLRCLHLLTRWRSF